MKINASLYYKRFSKRILRLEKIRKIGYIKIFFYFKKLSTRDMKVNLYNIYIFYPLIFFFQLNKKVFHYSIFPLFQSNNLRENSKFFYLSIFPFHPTFSSPNQMDPQFQVRILFSKVHQFLYLSICTFSFFLFGRSSKRSIFIESQFPISLLLWKKKRGKKTNPFSD